MPETGPFHDARGPSFRRRSRFGAFAKRNWLLSLDSNQEPSG